MNDTEIELEYSKDQDAKVGHKTVDTSFFGYKTHIAITPERIITAATITTGERQDGKELKNLIEKSQNNGIEIEAIIGDGAYSEKGDLDYCSESGIKNISKLSKAVTHGNGKNKDDFEYHKVQECMCVKQDIWQLLKGRQETKIRINKWSLIGVEKCKRCPFKEGCYKAGARTKTF